MANPKHVDLVRKGAKAFALWRLSNSDIIINLSDADLSGADLSKINLEKANLLGANLSKTNLSHANLSEAILTNADLSESNLTRANLFGADLIEADLSESTLIETNLSWANLTNTKLENAKLKDVDLSNAIGVDLSQTTGYVNPHDQQLEYSKVKSSRVLGSGYLMIVTCIMFVLGILGLGAAFVVIDIITSGKIQFSISVFSSLCILAAFSLVFGFCLGAIFIAKEKGYSGIIGFFLVGVPFVGLPIDILVRYFFPQDVMDTFAGHLTGMGQKKGGIAQDLLFSSDLFFLLPLPLVGLLILTLLPNQKQKH